MARLTAARRKRLRKSQFAGPNRSYPVDTKARAANAKGRATQMYKRGKISKSTKDRIHAKANRVLNRGKRKKRK